MMSSKECVRRAVKFEKPDRIPLGIMPPGFVSDLYCIGATADPAWTPKVNTEREREDEFGCIWSKLKDDKTMGQVTSHPLADFSRLDSFKFPDYTIRARYDSAREILKKNTGNKFVLAGIPLSLIHRLEYLRGHEAAWTDPYESPDRLRKLLNRLADMAIEAVDRFAELGVDGVMSSDDWGLQDRPMVSPDMFAEFWKPAYKNLKFPLKAAQSPERCSGLCQPAEKGPSALSPAPDKGGHVRPCTLPPLSGLASRI